MRVRGLKLNVSERTVASAAVAPRAGAWIETDNASCTAAWNTSHPVRVRGLKPRLFPVPHWLPASHPVRVRGLKHLKIAVNDRQRQSHPVRVRGLKLSVFAMSPREYSSHPVRVRGLKPFLNPSKARGHQVAPRAGAWIETLAARCLKE